MQSINFKKVDTIEGIKRIATIKENVAGYKHIVKYGVHNFRRGKLSYMISENVVDEDNEYDFTFDKFNYALAVYENVEYDDVRKFVTFEVVNSMGKEFKVVAYSQCTEIADNEVLGTFGKEENARLFIGIPFFQNYYNVSIEVYVDGEQVSTLIV